MDLYGFYTGNCFNAYEFLGAHRQNSGYVFRVYAPNASRITLIGDFNNWSEWEMNRICDNRFWEVFVPDAKEGMEYLYRIYDKNGTPVDHCDPYGYAMQLRPLHNSVICDIHPYRFSDSKWMKSRTDCREKPLNIYELHLGSWRKPDTGEFYTYTELAELLIPYLKENGYNYIELMPIAEHPLDQSWGYQNTGFYASTSRYGKPDQLKEFIDRCHNRNIGIILDYVPVHFAADEYGLRNFDGEPLYEYPHRDTGISEWGSCNFNHSRGEVRSFLMSNANFWLEEYHFDGLRMDAISRIIYWQGDEQRGQNGGGIDFIKTMNKGLKERHPSCMLIAEDSTCFPNVTASVDADGLGFDYKWDMGFMNDTLNFFRADPVYRHDMYHSLTFSMMYFYNEQYLLPFSHDENVHGKATIMQKMNGQYEDKFPQARALALYMYMHPGKKLNFMGGEFGQLREWDESRGQDWDILKYPAHDSFREFTKTLNKLYLSHSAFYEKDFSTEGFMWLECNDAENVVYVIERRSEDETLIALFNFSGADVTYTPEHLVGIPNKLLLHTDWLCYGGSTKPTTSVSFKDMTLPRFSGMLVKVK